MASSLYLMCAQCLAEQENPAWTAIYADTVYRGYALCLDHFRTLRASEKA